MSAVTEALTAAQLAELLARIERLETQVAELRAAEGAQVPRDVVLAISAAVAAYLGKRATIKQIRLAGDTAWARAGRTYVQGSHSRRR